MIPFEAVDITSVGSPFSLSNTYVTADFDPNGMLQSITTKDDQIKTETKIEFWEYGTKSRGDKSGAYLFLPDGAGKARKLNSPLVRIVEGKLRSTVTVHQPWIRHIVILNNSPGTDGTGLTVICLIQIFFIYLFFHRLKMTLT